MGTWHAGKKCIEDFGEETSRSETCWKTWKGENKIDLKEEGWEGMDWMNVAQNSKNTRNFMSTIMHRQVFLLMWEIAELAEKLLASERDLLYGVS